MNVSNLVGKKYVFNSYWSLNISLFKVWFYKDSERAPIVSLQNLYRWLVILEALVKRRCRLVILVLQYEFYTTHKSARYS